MAPRTPMSQSDASRVQSTQVIHGLTLNKSVSVKIVADPSSSCQQAKGDKDMSPGGFAARAQSAADNNANAGDKSGSNNTNKK